MGSGVRASAQMRPLLGFACNQGFVFSLFYMGANRAFAAGPVSFERAELFGTLLCMAAAFLLLGAVSAKARSALLARPLVWCYAALLVAGSVVPAVAGGTGAVGLAAECALIGLPAGFMLAAWGRALGAYTMRRFVMCAIGGSALGAALCLAASAASAALGDGALLALKALPLGSAWALCAHLRPGAPAAAGAIAAPAQARARAAGRLALRVIAGTVLFGVAAGFMETYSSEPGMMSNPTFPVSLLFFVLFCGAAFQMIASDGPAQDGAAPAAAGLPARGPLDDVYRLAILVMMAGFLFVPVLAGFGVPGEAVVLAGYLGLSAVLTCLFLVIAQLTGRDAALSFASGFTALFGGEMAGVALGNAFDLLGPSGGLPYASVACAGLAVLFAYLFLFTERDFRALTVIAQAADRFDDACRLIAEEAGLSRREAEVLPLALRGRTGERIAAELCISKSTVDTHLRRIYAKCGVHGRQELIDVGERTELGLSGRGRQ